VTARTSRAGQRAAAPAASFSPHAGPGDGDDDAVPIGDPPDDEGGSDWDDDEEDEDSEDDEALRAVRAACGLVAALQHRAGSHEPPRRA
jgi:hypothetical protein